MHVPLTSIREVAEYLDGLLETATIPDYPGAINGLQFENASSIRGVTAAVDFSSRAIEAAIQADSNLLVVHHGMFWGGPEPLRGPAYARIRKLVEHDIAVYSSHLPLDRHPKLGNNVLLAKELGLEPSGNFASYQGSSIGVQGESDIATATIAERVRHFSSEYETVLRSTRITADQRTRRWAICSGAGASADTLREVEEEGIDTLIVGEGPHWTAVHAEERGIAVLYAGHYATETLGVRALAEHLAARYGIKSNCASASTGL